MSLPPDLSSLSAPTRRWADTGTFLDVDGRRVFVHRAGPADGPRVLLIHGFPTSSHDWRGVTERLADTFSCAAPDQFGYGLSDKPEAFSYSLFQQADMVERVAGALGFDEVHLVSHDVGTSLHTELLARHQEGHLSFRLLSSTFLNGSIIKAMAHLTGLQKILQDPTQLDLAREECERLLPRYVESLKRYMARPEQVTDEDAVVMHELMAYQDGHTRIPGVYSYVRERYLMAERWLNALVYERTPVQVVWGTEDPIATVEMGRRIHELVPHARYTELERVGHFTPAEAPQEVSEAIRLIAAGGATTTAQVLR
jgi:pimeloyl-ACP methyl ester carboxylesterase